VLDTLTSTICPAMRPGFERDNARQGTKRVSMFARQGRTWRDMWRYGAARLTTEA
jgi:hypothetical protein